MSTAAKLFIGGVICAGLGLVLSASLHLSSPDPLRFVIYLLLTAIASGMKVPVPGVTGTLSVSFILILSAVMQLSLCEATDIAVISAIIQSFWHAKERPRVVHVLFSSGLMAISAGCAYAAYHIRPFHSSAVLAIGAATCTYFLINTALVAGVIAATEHKPLFRTWRDSYFWSFPYYLVGASIAASLNYVNGFHWEVALALLPMVFFIYRSYRLHLRQLEEEKRTAETMAALHLRTIETLALAIEAKDQTTADHLKRVQIYSQELCKDMQLPPDQEKALQAASILHDVGKLAVPDYIISKPGRLTPDEFSKMKIHPIVGAEIVERIEFPYPVAPIVRAHHEKWDGSGYPFGLKGEEIPIGARILSVVDCFDALASDRQYRKALPLEQAMAVVERESGKSFDPQVVKLLSGRYLQLEALAQSKPSRDQPQFSVDVKVTRGHSPDAGFEASVPNGDSQRRKPRDLALPQSSVGVGNLHEFGTTLGVWLSLTETLAVICARISGIVASDAIGVFMLHDTVLEPKYVHGENFKLLMSLRVPAGEGLVGWVAENHQPILNGNTSVEPGYRSGPEGVCTLKSVLAIPLQTTSATLGVLALYRTEKDAFSRDDQQRLLAIGDKVSLAVETAVQQEHRRASINLDVITGLPDARALFANLAAEIAKRRGTASTLTILACGLEGVATLHESFGRTAAEEALRVIAETFRQTCREVDYLAWRGEDQFVFVLPGVRAETLGTRVEMLRCIVREVVLQRWATEILSLSAGVAEFPLDGDSPDLLIGAAEKRMQQAKIASANDPTTDTLVRMTKSIVTGTEPAVEHLRVAANHTPAAT